MYIFEAHYTNMDNDEQITRKIEFDGQFMENDKECYMYAINYFSDLFIVAMVISWMTVLIVMVAVAVYATVKLSDTSMWSEVGNLVAVPLSCGGAIWMIKNSVQHAIAYSHGTSAKKDFPYPRVNADGEDDGVEEIMQHEENEDNEESEPEESEDDT